MLLMHNRYTQTKKKLLLALGVSVFLLSCVLALIVYAQVVIYKYNDHIITNIDELQQDNYTVVFGGGMISPGVQSLHQKERVETGVTLYKKGIASHLLMSGDDGTYKVNEVPFMKAQAVYSGVPVYEISVDGKGFRTIETCKRLATEQKQKKVIAISQQYHLTRIAYLCDFYNVEVIGVPAELVLKQEKVVSIREIFARVKAVLEVFYLGLLAR